MTESSSDSPTAAIVAGIAFLPAIYVAFWVINWGSGDSLLRYILPVAFCIIVPSIIGSTVAALTSRD